MLAEKAGKWGVPLKDSFLRDRADRFIRARLEDLRRSPEDGSTVELTRFLDLTAALHLELDLWDIQNVFNDLAAELTDRLKGALGKTLCRTRP